MTTQNEGTQRDELADEIAGHPIGSGYYSTMVGMDEAREIADAILAAGYRKPRTITTVEGLAALFEGAYGTDADGLLWKIDGGTCAWTNIDDGVDEEYQDGDIKLPFTLLSPEIEVGA